MGQEGAKPGSGPNRNNSKHQEQKRAKQPSRKQKTAATNPQSARVVLLNGGAVEIILWSVAVVITKRPSEKPALVGKLVSTRETSVSMSAATSPLIKFHRLRKVTSTFETYLGQRPGRRP